MSKPNYTLLVRHLVDDDIEVRQSAYDTLITLDEDAIHPLIDEWHAGVTDAWGIAILDVVAEIGGPDAMSMLRNVFHFEESRYKLQYAAAKGLLLNLYNLSPHERDEVQRFLNNN